MSFICAVSQEAIKYKLIESIINAFQKNPLSDVLVVGPRVGRLGLTSQASHSEQWAREK